MLCKNKKNEGYLMPKTIPIRIIEDCIIERCLTGASKLIGLELDIFERRLDFKIAAVGNARLADIVPAARAICDKIVDITTEYIRSKEGNIPCCKGCHTCCNYLVSLSAPEALYFREEIFHKQNIQHNSTMRNYLNAASRIVKHRLPEQVLECSSGLSGNTSKMKALADWYAGLKITCPFLCDGHCAIYKQRPLVCREHFVIGSARGCRGDSCETQVINMHVQMGNVLCRLSKELCGVDDAVIMPLALAWCDINKQLCERTWPAEVMTNLLIKIIKEMFPFSL
jgi:Fe-S-cluster containining protein